MNSPDDRELEAIDAGLAGLFAAEQPVPAHFTVHVLRSIQEQRWKREVWLGRVLYGGLCASGILVLAGLAFAFATLPTLSGDAALRIAVVALVFSGAASWTRLAWARLS